MPVNNSITQNVQRRPLPDKPVSYQVNGREINLSPSVVRAYLTNGDGNKVTDQEIAYFMNLCRYQGLNPFTKEAYLIKYGDKPAQIVTGIDALRKRAMRNPNYRGHEAGVIVITQDQKVENRIGSCVMPGEQLVGGWARTHINGYTVPIETTVSFREFSQDTPIWRSKPGTMIRKVALATSLREAFPEDLGGMYAPEEMGVSEETELSQTPINMPEEVAAPQPQQMEPEDYTQIPPNFDEPTVDEFPEDF